MKFIIAIKNLYFRLSNKRIDFSSLSKKEKIYLYAGDVPNTKEYSMYTGLSLTQWNENHIKHNVLEKYPIESNTVDRYQSEDVFEHLYIEELPRVINEIYRVLKKGGVFRLSLPDYRCPLLFERAQKNENGEIIFDPLGGGSFIDGKITEGGHQWFPTYEQVKKLLEESNFSNINFLHFYNENGEGITNTIDYSMGFVKRTPDHDDRVKNPYRPLSIVVDCVK